VSDPWAPSALASIVDWTSRGDQVLLIGTGLTAVDLALSLVSQGRRVIAVSRNGWLPRRHHLPLAAALPLADETVAPLTADELVALVERHIRASVATPGGWRAAVDGLRPVTSKLWGRLPADEKRTLLGGRAREWEVLRHRIAPALADEVTRLVARKALTVGKAEVLAAVGDERAWRVTLRCQGAVSKLSVAAVVNCTGPSCDVRRHSGGLGARLLDSGLAVADDLDLGVRTNSEGGVVDTDGNVDGRLWTLGALRRGSLYESTAIPELRSQATVIAERLAATLAVNPHRAAGPGQAGAESSPVQERPPVVDERAAPGRGPKRRARRPLTCGLAMG